MANSRTKKEGKRKDILGAGVCVERVALRLKRTKTKGAYAESEVV